MFLLDIRDFQDHLILTLKQELTKAVVGNKNIYILYYLVVFPLPCSKQKIETIQ